MLDINSITTYDELSLVIFDVRLAGITNQKSNVNPSFSKETMIWYWINICRDNIGKEIPEAILQKTRDAVNKDFGINK